MEVGGYAAPYLKVTVFVTREAALGRELLVFRHPTAGVQLPAGSVELGEAVEAAALREVAEETGLTDTVIVASLGTRTYTLPDNGRVAAQETALCLMPGGSEQGFSVRRELTVHEIERNEAHSHVELREYVVRDSVPQIDKVTATGWVPSHDLSCAVERHFFHFKAVASTRNAWTWFAEDAHDFRCYWVPLSDDPGLVSGQDEWLSWFVNQLQETDSCHV